MCFIAMTTGYTFSVTEKNSMERLYGILPVKKSEMVMGRYLFVVVLGVIYQCGHWRPVLVCTLHGISNSRILQIWLYQRPGVYVYSGCGIFSDFVSSS